MTFSDSPASHEGSSDIPQPPICVRVDPLRPCTELERALYENRTGDANLRHVHPVYYPVAVKIPKSRVLTPIHGLVESAAPNKGWCFVRYLDRKTAQTSLRCIAACDVTPRVTFMENHPPESQESGGKRLLIAIGAGILLLLAAVLARKAAEQSDTESPGIEHRAEEKDPKR